jgi:hypothetical protein
MDTQYTLVLAQHLKPGMRIIDALGNVTLIETAVPAVVQGTPVTRINGRLNRVHGITSRVLS